MGRRVQVEIIPPKAGVGFRGKTAVVIDALRATSSIVTAMSNGCRAVVPVLSTEEAVEIRMRYDGEVLLCGEREAQIIPGFNLGNSPAEYTRERVEAKTLVMATTNGTRAIRMVEHASPLYVGAFLNLDAVVKAAVEKGQDVVLICAGRCGRVSLEDLACAGRMVELLVAQGWEADDSAQVALLAYQSFQGKIKEIFKASEHGKHLLELGFGEDLALCAQESVTDVVPIYRDGLIVLAS